jgi:hypothetical protein
VPENAVADIEILEPSKETCDAPSPILLPAALYLARAAQQMVKAAALIDRQMTALPTQAQQWRAAATDLNVTGALSDDQNIQAAMFKLADTYQCLALRAEERYTAFLQNRSSCRSKPSPANTMPLETLNGTGDPAKET